MTMRGRGKGRGKGSPRGKGKGEGQGERVEVTAQGRQGKGREGKEGEEAGMETQPEVLGGAAEATQAEGATADAGAQLARVGGVKVRKWEMVQDLPRMTTQTAR